MLMPADAMVLCARFSMHETRVEGVAGDWTPTIPRMDTTLLQSITAAHCVEIVTGMIRAALKDRPNAKFLQLEVLTGNHQATTMLIAVDQTHLFGDLNSLIAVLQSESTTRIG